MRRTFGCTGWRVPPPGSRWLSLPNQVTRYCAPQRLFCTIVIYGGIPWAICRLSAKWDFFALAQISVCKWITSKINFKMDSCDSDKFYILWEFNNEQKIDKIDEQQTIPVQVGYAEWIIWDDKNKEPRKPISNLIQNKESVLMKWPSNCDVQSKNIMAKRKHIKWIQSVECILAQSNGKSLVISTLRKFSISLNIFKVFIGCVVYILLGGRMKSNLKTHTHFCSYFIVIFVSLIWSF